MNEIRNYYVYQIGNKCTMLETADRLDLLSSCLDFRRTSRILGWISLERH